MERVLVLRIPILRGSLRGGLRRLRRKPLIWLAAAAPASGGSGCYARRDMWTLVRRLRM